MDYIHQTQDRAQWRAFVNTVKNLRVLHSTWNILTS
jgi:hypothetical protein